MGVRRFSRMDHRFSRRTGAVLVASFAAVVFVDAARQTREEPPPTGPTVTIRGRLVAADTNLPFRDAEVSLQRFSTQPAPPGREAMEWMASSSVTVDSEGRFEFASVAAGSYRLVANPARTVMRYIQGFYPEASMDNPRALTVSAQHAPAEIVIVLPRGAAITRPRRRRARDAVLVTSRSAFERRCRPDAHARRRGLPRLSPCAPTITGAFASSVFRRARTS